MILVIFGQPASGKTTLAKHLVENNFHHIDGDELRDIFNNKNYSREGRIKNLNRASDIALYLNSKSFDVVLSLVYPYEECRKYLNNLTKDIKWVYLIYNDDRGRNDFKVKDFEEPYMSYLNLIINTSDTSIEESVNKIRLICKIS